MDEKKMLSRIERNPDIMFGKPVIKGTRLPVDLLIEKLAYGCDEKKILEEYNFITIDDIHAALLYAAKMVSLEEALSAV